MTTDLILVKSGHYSDKRNHFLFRGTEEDLQALAKEFRALYNDDPFDGWDAFKEKLEAEATAEKYAGLDAVSVWFISKAEVFEYWLRKKMPERIVELRSWHAQDGGLE